MDKIPDEIQKKIEEKFPGGYWNHRPAEFGYSLASEQLLEKDKTIEKLTNALSDLAIKYDDAGQGWVSVDERLPDGDFPVLVCCTEFENVKEAQHYFYVATLFGGKEWTTDSEILYFVTHWQPLPAPPIKQNP